MKLFSLVALSVVLCFGTVAVASAADVTLTGTVMCAKCKLKKSDATECQDVLVVDENGGTAQYYIVKNAVAEKFGHSCTGENPATVTGQVTEKDGRKWIEASKMEKTGKTDKSGKTGEPAAPDKGERQR